MSEPERYEFVASRLGFLGLVPFVGLAIATLLAPPNYAAFASQALLAYGATILSFLGGIYWGGILARRASTPTENVFYLTVGVIPQLLGWVALLSPAPFGHLLTAAGLLALLAIDHAAVRAGLAPVWFLKLRWALSCAAAIAMIIGAINA